MEFGLILGMSPSEVSQLEEKLSQVLDVILEDIPVAKLKDKKVCFNRQRSIAFQRYIICLYT